uniref:Nudix hydrolase domain-containing protein n=1 Tax=Davidia involucrata TaxID=16924 RepID=A0A5B7CE44_DAVIN
MSYLPARTGRHRQRYMDQLRLVAGCIPFRLEKIVEDRSCNLENRLLILMISSPNRDGLVFPKGGWEDDETMAEAACREALEEAGVKGILGDKPLGDWEFRSKSRQKSCSLEGGCRGYMFAFEVTEELDSWPEQANYVRKWLTVDDAFKFCRYDWMREALRKFLKVLPEGSTNEARKESLEFPMIPVADARAQSQKLASGCYEKPSGVQHLDESCNKCAVQG